MDKYELQQGLEAELSFIGEERQVNNAQAMIEITIDEYEFTNQDEAAVESVIADSNWELEGIQFDGNTQKHYMYFER